MVRSLLQRESLLARSLELIYSLVSVRVGPQINKWSDLTAGTSGFIYMKTKMKMPVKLFLLVEGVGFKFEKLPIQSKQQQWPNLAENHFLRAGQIPKVLLWKFRPKD